MPGIRTHTIIDIPEGEVSLYSVYCMNATKKIDPIFAVLLLLLLLLVLLLYSLHLIQPPPYLPLCVLWVVANPEHGAVVAPPAGTVFAPHALVPADELRLRDDTPQAKTNTKTRKEVN